MKMLIKRVVRGMAGLPVLGRLIRIAVAVARLPRDNELRDALAREQLPMLLKNISDLNARVLAAERDPANLVESTPVALRMMARELAALRERIDQLEAGLRS
ncbi:hypothetical protein F2P45_25095 [Massilia sp. CCM 8733]|uniref:Uncharacterized protein n=1 Tax=Massilia mucilaginosa TaxID=2609282 RepID=A0ABX0P017_9BURK|nr:hypothetical protein [Massilia mucilaginosa]NHZ92255.1 hypothetical protein [Massilia mucilaginosa]